MKVQYAKDLYFPFEIEANQGKLGKILNIFENPKVEKIKSTDKESAEKLDTLLEYCQAVWVVNDGRDGNNHATIYTNSDYETFKYVLPEIIMIFAKLKHCSITKFTLYVNYWEINERIFKSYELKLEEV